VLSEIRIDLGTANTLIIHNDKVVIDFHDCCP
jgi:actin-like ATPase involved in cell morphogenesis